MPVYRGAKNQTLYLGAGHADGTSNVWLYLGDKPVYIPFRPPEGDLLQAGPGVYLKSAAQVYVDYKNTPVLASDGLSGKDIGTGPFDISFIFRPDKTASYRKLFEVPGLVSFAYNWQQGYGLLVDVKGVGLRAISTEYIQGSAAMVRLFKKNEDSDIVLAVGEYRYTLVKSWATYMQPSYSDFNGWRGNKEIYITLDNLTTTISRPTEQYNQYLQTITKPYGADDAEYAKYRYHVDPRRSEDWFKFEFSELLRIKKCKYSVAGYDAYSTKEQALAQNMIMTGDYQIYLCDNEDKNKMFSGPFQLENKSAIMLENDYWRPYNTAEKVFTTPIKTKSLAIVFSNISNTNFLGYSWQYYGHLSIDAEKYIGGSYTAGQLAVYDRTGFKNLTLKGTYRD